MTGRPSQTRTLAQLMAGLAPALYLGPTHTPEYHPRKHTVETYRSQQRKAKKRRKFNAKKSKR